MLVLLKVNPSSRAKSIISAFFKGLICKFSRCIKGSKSSVPMYDAIGLFTNLKNFFRHGILFFPTKMEFEHPITFDLSIGSPFSAKDSRNSGTVLFFLF